MNWQYVRLGDVIAEARPGFASGSDVSDGIAQLRMNNLTRDGKLDWSKVRRVDLPKKVDHLLLAPGDVLFNATNSPDLVGKTAFFDGFHEPITFSNHFLRLRPIQEKLDGKFLAHWMHKQFESGAFQRMCKQWVNQATVSRDLLLSLDFPLPPLDEQQRIAAILDQAEKLRAMRRVAIDLLDQLPQAIFLEQFGDPVSNPHGWASGTLSEIALQITDGEHQTPKRQALGIKLLSARNVKDGYLDFSDVDHVSDDEYARISKRCDPKRGDILISCSGTIGRVAPVAVDEPLSLVRSAALVRPKLAVIDTPFLVEVLRTPALRRRMVQRANASSQANLFQNQIRELPVILPPIKLQHEFGVRIESIRRSKVVHQSAFDELNALFAALRAHSFGGTDAG